MTKSEEVGLRLFCWIIGAIIGTCIVEGVYVYYLDGQMRQLSANACVRGQ